MGNPKSYLTTRLLDEPSRIGPFFFREFVKVIILLLLSAWVVGLCSLFVDVPGTIIFLVPAITLLMVGLLRWALKDQIISPWYLELWISRSFIRPTTLHPRVERFSWMLVRLKKHSPNHKK